MNKFQINPKSWHGATLLILIVVGSIGVLRGFVYARPYLGELGASKILSLLGITIGDSKKTQNGAEAARVFMVTNEVSPSMSPRDTNVSPIKTPSSPSSKFVSPMVSPIVTPSKSNEKSPPPSTSPSLLSTGRVVINEIAWAGTDASAIDEWIELYNTENQSIDISGWNLKSDDESPNIIFTDKTIIAAGGYFLIERTNDAVVSNINADFFGSFGQGGLNNNGEKLTLSDKTGKIIDSVGMAGNGWFAGDLTPKTTMARIDPQKDGNNASNWKNFSGDNFAGRDSKNNFIKGTPRNKNSPVMPTPTPSLTPSPTPTPLVSFTPTPTPSATPTPSDTPSPSLNPSPTLTPTPTPTPSSSPPIASAIVINEIAWMGTATQSSDEWLELYNTTNQDISVDGWVLKSETDGSPNIILTGAIGAFGFYLLERTNDEPIKDITADFKGSFGTGGLKNTGEMLVLKDGSGNIQDTVDSSLGWYAGIASPDYKSMERINPSQSGDNASNWATNNGLTRNGHDAAGNPINGTPRALNSNN